MNDDVFEGEIFEVIQVFVGATVNIFPDIMLERLCNKESPVKLITSEAHL